MIVVETDRLLLSTIELEDAPFILALLNEPSFLRFIGDKGVHSLEEARDYIREGPRKSYELHGFGLWRVSLQTDATPIGICGLLKRDSLPDVDVGFAFLPEHWGKGYALESAEATLQYGMTELGLSRIVAITSMDNERSARLLEKIGMCFERKLKLSEDDEELRLFAIES